MINYVYVWFANFRLRFLGCLDWNICFTQIFFSILISVWSFQCTIWLNLYQSSEASIFWILWSLVKPVLSKTALPCWSRLALACPFYIRSSACIAVIFLLIWQPPAFPYRHQYSIIGRFRLNHRVRDVDGCFPKAHRHQNMRIKFCGTKFTNLCGKLAFLSGFVNFCISGTPATERTCSRGFAKRSCLITGQWIISTWFP